MSSRQALLASRSCPLALPAAGPSCSIVTIYRTSFAAFRGGIMIRTVKAGVLREAIDPLDHPRVACEVYAKKLFSVACIEL